MFYAAIGYALTLAAAEIPQVMSDLPVATAQVALVAEDGAPADHAQQVAVNDPSGQTEEVDHELERAARDFRIATYQNHRLDRATYDRHILAGHAAHHAWKRNPGSESERAELLDWYAGAHAELPALPSFLAGEGEMLAADVPASEPSLLPPTASATPVPPLEMNRAETALEEMEAEQGEEETTTSDPLNELSWSDSDNAFDNAFDNSFESELRQDANQFNRDVADLHTRLSGDEPWTTANLEPVSLQLSDLAAQRQILDVRARAQSTPTDELLSLNPAIDLFGQRVAEARGHAEREGSGFSSRNELGRVEALEGVHARLQAGN